MLQELLEEKNVGGILLSDAKVDPRDKYILNLSMRQSVLGLLKEQRTNLFKGEVKELMTRLRRSLDDDNILEVGNNENMIAKAEDAVENAISEIGTAINIYKKIKISKVK